ncbi:general stress protein [Microbacterium sp. HMH0099]|uniref:general stress protein n=1 Tax=Microbacterium sp. HMH0099 TaxID=3414026 RepID=UPI003BF6C673
MSMFGGTPATGRDEVGEKVASFPTYEAAQKAVSSLIAGEVPARDISIVGSGLRSIEKVTGRLGYARAARSGALNGLMLGLLFAFIFVLGMPTVQISAFVGVLLVGMALGMLLSLGTYSIVRRRRDFASVMQVAADHYDVCVSPANLAKARGVLGTGAARTVVARPPAPVDDERPRYGERVAPGTGGASRPEAPASGPAAPPALDEPPRYGERIVPPTPDAPVEGEQSDPHDGIVGPTPGPAGDDHDRHPGPDASTPDAAPSPSHPDDDPRASR